MQVGTDLARESQDVHCCVLDSKSVMSYITED